MSDLTVIFPEKVVLNVLSCLETRELESVACVNKKLNNLTKEFLWKPEFLWKAKVEERFGNEGLSIRREFSSWKETYLNLVENGHFEFLSLNDKVTWLACKNMQWIKL